MDARTYDITKKGIKIGVVLVSSIAAIVIGKRLIARVKNASNTAALDQVVNDVVNKSGEAANISQAQATTIAQGFYNAMESTGTDEAAIERLAAQLKNAADWAMVVKAFGYKDYGTYGSPLYSWLPSTPTNLLGWLRNECGSSLIKKLESVWTKYGIVG